MSGTDRIRRVVLCADDFALDEASSEGILRLAAAGRLGAVTAMTAGARWPAAWERLGEMPPTVALGLHVNLVDGRGLSDRERFPSAPELALNAAAGRLPPAWLHDEIDAQWAAFEASAGRAPDFLDTHRHVHVLAAVSEAMLAVAAARGHPIPLRALWPAVGPRDARGKRFALRLLGARRLARRLDALGLSANRAFGGLQAFAAPARVEQGWREMLPQLPDGALVACHPAFGIDPTDPIGAFRDAEFRWLASDAFPTASLAAGLQWVPGPIPPACAPASVAHS
ncbi:MAG: ChbG/HpnK family deacetylase [Burkholderiales bacterium]|nr:ChbG/HpnK family deacetylase [Burkholderiales bacterium]